MLLPVLLPDESMASLLTRLCRINGVRDFCDLGDLLLGPHWSKSFINAEVDFSEICRFTGITYGGPEEILRQMTWLPWQDMFGEFSSVERRRLSGESPYATLGELTFHNSAVVVSCAECMEEDVAEFGMAYWHRVLQVPVVRCCPKHGGELIRIELRRPQLHSTFPLPGDYWDRRSSGQPSLAGTQLWLSIAQTVNEMFHDNLALESSDVVNFGIWDELRTRNLVTPSGAFRATQIQDGLAHWSNGKTELIGLSAERFAQRVTQSLLEPRQGMAFGRSVVITWLFGEWRAFQEKCRWVRALNTVEAVTQQNQRGLPRTGQDRNKHREICVNFMIRMPELQRADFAKMESQSFRWLLHNDRAWLELQLPIPMGKPVQLSLFD